MKQGWIKDEFGNKCHYVDGKPHREDGPAVIHADSSQEWWLNGKRHREDGPARTWANGAQEWWLNGKCYGNIETKEYLDAVAKLQHKLDNTNEY